MLKLTKAQMKDRDRIEAWLKGEPFRENSRDKNPKVPELSADQILETYVPEWISDGAKYYTPREMALWLGQSTDVAIDPRYPFHLLEPCAGIGNLLQPWADQTSASIFAYDLDPEAVEIGRKLFPLVEWHRASVLDDFEAHRSKYDMVVMNPPIGISWGTAGGMANSATGAVKSEHLFLEFAVHALKPGGVLAALATYNWIDRLPKKLRAWFDERVETVDIDDLGEAPGEFRFTKITVHGWVIRRNERHHPQMKQFRETEVKAAIPPNAVHVPHSVYDALATVERGEYLASVKRTTAILKASGFRKIAKWVESHPLEYGQGYWMGFVSDDKPLLLLS